MGNILNMVNSSAETAAGGSPAGGWTIWLTPLTAAVSRFKL